MLSLRKIEPSDLPFLYRWENDEQVWSEGAVHNPLSHQDLRSYIESTTGDFYADGQLRLMVELTDESHEKTVLIGCADLTGYDARNRKAELGLYLAPEYRGKHFAREIVQMLERLAFTHLGLRMIYAVIPTNNLPSSRLFERLGYSSGALLRAWTLESDARVYQRVKDESIPV